MAYKQIEYPLSMCLVSIKMCNYQVCKMFIAHCRFENLYTAYKDNF